MAAAAEEEHKIIARGNSGIVYYPAIRCPELPDIDVTKYVSKLMRKDKALKEKRSCR